MREQARQQVGQELQELECGPRINSFALFNYHLTGAHIFI